MEPVLEEMNGTGTADGPFGMTETSYPRRSYRGTDEYQLLTHCTAT